MKTVLKYSFSLLFIAMSFQGFAQDDAGYLRRLADKGAPKPKRNLLKVEMAGLLYRNTHLSYEAILGKHVSVGVSYRFMTPGSLPFQSVVTNLTGSSDPDVTKTLSMLKLENNAITPEIRFYVGRKGYGRGFYLAPFYRKANHTVSGVSVDLTSTTPITIALSGKLSSSTYGLLLGSQFKLANFLALDWWILGPHIGKMTGEISGTSSRALNAVEQNELRQNLQDLDIFGGTVTVDANSARLKTGSGIWGGIRAGLCLGIRF